MTRLLIASLILGTLLAPLATAATAGENDLPCLTVYACDQMARQAAREAAEGFPGDETLDAVDAGNEATFDAARLGARTLFTAGDQATDLAWLLVDEADCQAEWHVTGGCAPTYLGVPFP